MSDWQTLSPRQDINMSVADMDKLILDLLSLRTLFLLLHDSEAIENCKLLVAIAEALLIECWDFDNLQMNRSEAISRHLEHAVKRRLGEVQSHIRAKVEDAGENSQVLRAIENDAHTEMSEIQGRLDTIVGRNKDRFRYGTIERIRALVRGDDQLINWLERDERINRTLRQLIHDLDEDDEGYPEELNANERRLLGLLRDPYDHLDAETRRHLEARGVDLTGVKYLDGD